MTEQEMNLKVAEVLVGLPMDHWSHSGSGIVIGGYNVDFCNRDGDWGRLARIIRIDIAHQDSGMVFAGAGKCGGDFYKHEATDNKIGVAVVKAFLMMNGVEL